MCPDVIGANGANGANAATVDSRYLPAPERQWRAALTLPWPLALGLAPLLVAAEGLSLCAFRQISGHPCPLCGGTHACAALVEGQWLAAWQANPGLLPLLALAAAFTVQSATEAWSGRRVARGWPGPRRWSQLGWAGVAWLIIAWGLRLSGWL